MTENGKALVQEPPIEPTEPNSTIPISDVLATVESATSGTEPAIQVPSKPKAPIAWPRLSEGLIVGTGTVTAYFVALTYQSGYNAALGIPESLIDVSPEALYHSLFPMLLAFALEALILFPRIAWTSDAPSNSIFWKDLVS